MINVSFFRHVWTFDKKERNLRLNDYIYCNTINTESSCLRQKEIVAHFSCVQICRHSQHSTSQHHIQMKVRKDITYLVISSIL